MFDAARELSCDVRTRFYINGDWVKPASAQIRRVVDPLGNEVLQIPVASTIDIERAIRSARSSFENGPWAASEPKERAQYLRRLSEAVRRRIPLFARLWTAQVGAPIALTTRLAGAGLQRLEYNASILDSFSFEQSRQTHAGYARVRKVPAGVAVLIIPWNAAFPILCHKLGAALAAGCTCIVKPSPESPLDAMLLAECAHEAGLPSGVINVVNAEEEASAELVAHPEVDTVSFTGSFTTGRMIAAACAANMTRHTLELGGKSSAILLGDADTAHALDALMPFIMPFSGQICFSQSRILVPKAKLDDVVSSLKLRLEALRVGDPWDAATEMGPVLNGRQARRIAAYIESGLSDGARIVTGGEIRQDLGSGHWVQPTLFSGVRYDMKIAREEIFGPVCTVEVYEDEEDAVFMANFPGMGLSGSIYSSDVRRAHKMAARLRAGQVGINRLEVAPSAPFGGFKRAGIGREGGLEGIEAFLETQAVLSPLPAEWIGA
ncbi:aldehyde dehydrogenase family protein [Sphingomonas sp. RRHST34]|uniref:Aldehyde dehydrogenase family protein n=1 Tax=Sphingomonas citri TaxID=2862499 RepID=A0ABS7BT55_9SPHN|nr:aldehyde dehydrogenase family protein [Sphingomonas citri]MBW6532781.1 aldehyde dehydrogenase family protein [Sphingomonas citri]